MASQSRAARCARKRSYDSACRVFQPRRWSAELVEPGERGVEVCLVEDFAAADQVAFERQKWILRHSASKPSLRGSMQRLGDDRSEIAQPMHSLDVDREVRRQIPSGAEVCGHVAGRERARAGDRC